MTKRFLSPLRWTSAAGLLCLAGAVVATGQNMPVGNAERGQKFFQSACAICHSPALGPDNTLIIKQGPTLLGVMGRKAGTSPHFNYTQALKDSGLVWDVPALDHFLTDPARAVPGTTMPIPLPDAGLRADVIAYLATLKVPEGISLDTAAFSVVNPTGGNDPNDWQRAAPGVQHHFTIADLPAPFATQSAGNPPSVVANPPNATLSVPAGFTVKQFASGLNNPRLLRMAPNGDIFISETGRNRVRVLRANDGADAPSENQIFAEGLQRPFGIAFYPLGDNPQWLYVANINSVVRFPYHNGDLKASGPAEVIVQKLCDGSGGHSTRDVVFSKDGKRMFISVGSGSNVAEEMEKKTPDEIKAWESEHGFGATWGPEANRANILVTDPEGHEPLRAYATGIRNGVGMAINPTTGDLWVSTNERDALGDNLVPDYVTSVKEGGFYGWPWYYMGKFEDPRHAGERPDLAGKAIVPDVLEQSHSASLEMTFYTAGAGVAAFPAEYQGDAFVALHGSWNRSTRTGYKVARIRFSNGVATGEYDDFMTGFVVDDEGVWGRPVGVTVAHDGALLVTEDGHGTIWRIAYTGH
ncbi:MAG TPA: PQQ-dependent sugar dehydrogenase [Candidatus Baltobacteraceae bacterium]|nr:PQQ-dependent sugar dehydrogenase [Candidatus Baltobacteraceae bacterium]